MQHVLSHHITKAVKYRAEQHKRVVAPFVRRVTVEPGTTSPNMPTLHIPTAVACTAELPAPSSAHLSSNVTDHRSPVSVQHSPNSTTSSMYSGNRHDAHQNHQSHPLSPYECQSARSAYNSYRSNSLAIGADMSQLIICSPEIEHSTTLGQNNSNCGSTGYDDVQQQQRGDHHHRTKRAYAFHQGVFDDAVRRSSNNSNDEPLLDYIRHRHPQQAAFHPSRPRATSLPYGRRHSISLGVPHTNSYSSSIDCNPFDDNKLSPQQLQQVVHGSPFFTKTALRTASVPCTGSSSSGKSGHYEGRHHHADDASYTHRLASNTQHNIHALLTAVEYERSRNNGQAALSTMAECSSSDSASGALSQVTSMYNHDGSSDDAPITVVQVDRFASSGGAATATGSAASQQLGHGFLQSAVTPPVTVGSREDLSIWRPF